MASGKAREPVKSALADRHIKALNMRLRVCFEDEGCEYGPDATDDDTLVYRTTVATTLRKKRIAEVFRAIRRAHFVQLCFVVDCTGSMGPHISGVKESIYDIVRQLTVDPSGKNPDAQAMNIAFVCYRDFPPESGSGQFQVLPFIPASDVARFRDFVGRLRADGGRNAEDVFGGLYTALNLPWSQDCGTNVIFHICDMPCHGNEFQRPGFHDSHPRGDPHGRTSKDLFARLRQKGIQYHFGRIGADTDVMIKKFSEVYGEPICEFDVKNVGNIRDSVITAVNQSISASVSTSKRTVGVERAVRDVVLVTADPLWSWLPEVQGTLASYKFPARIEDIEDDVPLVMKKTKVATVKIAKHPFGKGAERLAYYGKDLSTCRGPAKVEGGKKASRSAEAEIVLKKKDEDIVVKEYLHVGKGMNSAGRYQLSNQLQTVAAYLAQEFCKDLKDRAGITKTIKFMKIKTLYLKDTLRFMTYERRIAATDKFVRFTNNTDYHMMEEKAVELGVSLEFVQLVTALSHWTYKATNRFLMVVDLEGIVSRIEGDGETGVLLTDPAIHCKDLTRYGPMNHGLGGMRNFFASHRCNRFCEMLGLVRFAPK